MLVRNNINPQQGMLIVLRPPEDRCAANYADTGESDPDTTPYQKGALTHQQRRLPLRVARLDHTICTLDNCGFILARPD